MTAETTELQTAAPTEVGALALITLKPEAYAAEVYAPFKTRLAAAIESVRSIDYDIATTKGLEVATKARRLMMDIRIEANKERELRKAPITLIGKLLQSSYATVEEYVLPLETFFDEEIKAEEKRKEDAKQAKIIAERLRVEAITERIATFGKLAIAAAGKTSTYISVLQTELAALEITDELFEEFIPQATVAKADAATALELSYASASNAEQAAETERLQREEEDRQRAAQAAENERQRIALEKVALAQAEESKRLAAAAKAQQEEIERKQREADAQIREKAEAETKRIQAEADARALEHAKALKLLNDQRAAFEAEQQAAQKVKDDAARLDADHGEALLLDFLMTEAWEQQQNELASAVHAPAIADALIAKSLDAQEAEPTDEEIVEAYIAAFGGTAEQACERLERFATTLVA